MSHADNNDQVLRARLNQETAKIAWSELQYFFASGAVISVAKGLDLVDVAQHFSKDNKAQIRQWLQEEKVGKVSDSQAVTWFESDAVLWSVVVKPWVLVQPV